MSFRESPPFRPLNIFEKSLIYGCLGLCVEIFFTALWNHQLTLKGHTYLWMVPVWTCGFFALGRVERYVRKYHYLIRGVAYTMTCLTVEYLSGMYFLLTLGVIPWDYSEATWNVHGAIRLDYLPFWFIAGLLSEYVIDFVNSLRVKLDRR